MVHSMTSAKRIAVVFGGRSVEHEVSIITAHQAMNAMKVAGYDLLPIYIGKDGAWFAGKPLHDLPKYKDLTRDFGAIADVHRVSLSADRSVRQLVIHPAKQSRFFRAPVLWAEVFFPLIHGSFGEDGTLQGALEMADVPYVGCDVLSSATSMDKFVMKSICKANGIPVIDALRFPRADIDSDLDSVIAGAESLGEYPLIVKPVHLGSSIGVRRCDTRAALIESLRAAAMLDSHVLVEPALANFIEINCSVMAPPTEVSVCEQPTTGGDILSFDAKYRQGGKGSKSSGMASLGRVIPAPVSDAITTAVQEFSAKAFGIVNGSGVARVDFLFDKTTGQLYFNEINTVPGSLAYYLWEASNVPFDVLVGRLIDGAVRRHEDRGRTLFSFQANLLA
jgi:D-alanine-D-alanine ligase